MNGSWWQNLDKAEKRCEKCKWWRHAFGGGGVCLCKNSPQSAGARCERFVPKVVNIDWYKGKSFKSTAENALKTLEKKP